MNEIYELRQEISSLQLKLQQEKFNQSGNNHVSEKDENIIFEKFKNQIGVLSKRKSTIKRRDDDKTTDDRNDSSSK